MNPNTKSEYERLKSKSILDVCMERAQLDGAVSSSRLAQLVYEEKQMEQKFKYEKQQIKLQHEVSLSLLKEQLDGQAQMIKAQIKSQTRWMRYSIIGVLVASIIGATIGAILQPVVSQMLTTLTQSTQEKMIEP